MKKIIIIILLLAVATSGYLVWRNKTKPKAQPPTAAIKVVTYTVVPSKLQEKISSIGTLEANEATIIKAEVTGKVAKIDFREGQATRAGDLILQINDDSYLETLKNAQAAFELAKITYNRNIQLQKSGAVALQAKDDAEATVRKTEADYEIAKIRLGKTQITAPFDGIVGVSTISVGAYLNIGDPIVSIAAIDPLKMQFTLPQKYLSNIKDNAPVIITTDAWPGKEFEGHIYAIDPQIDVDTRNITIKALVPNNEELLRPGLFAYINVGIAEIDDALMVPEEALIPSTQLVTVMKVVDNKAQVVKVKVGIRQNGMAQITEGLQAGDVVITAGNLKVREGTLVEAVSGKMPSEENFEAKK